MALHVGPGRRSAHKHTNTNSGGAAPTFFITDGASNTLTDGSGNLLTWN